MVDRSCHKILTSQNKMADVTKEKLFLYDDNSSSVADPQIAKRSIEIFTQLGVKLSCDSILP